MTFDDTANAVANCNVNGRGGLRLNPARYEAELLEKLKTGEALGQNVVAPLEVVKAIFSLRKQGEYKRLSDHDLPGRLTLLINGIDGANWQWSCTPRDRKEETVRAVDFTRGNDIWRFRDHVCLSGRACFAELAP
ncbi:MAG TPA: hypothetical protein VK752_05970 [Bryobacteraceae bacterium]|nr:hypothetical protein [Bryobacteraceae bacterium]